MILLLSCLVITLVSAAQDSLNVYTDIYFVVSDRKILGMLDSLQDAIDKKLIEQKKLSETGQDKKLDFVFYSSPPGAHWGWHSDVKYLPLPGSHSRTDIFELNISFSRPLDTLYINCFTRQYRCNYKYEPSPPKKITADTTSFYYVPLTQYRKVISPSQFNRLPGVIRTILFDHFELSRTGKDAYRKTEITSAEARASLPQLPFDHTLLELVIATDEKRIKGYKDPSLSEEMSHDQAYELFSMIDTNYVEDMSTGKMVETPVLMIGPADTIVVVDKWQQVERKSAVNDTDPLLVFKRNVTAIGMRYKKGTIYFGYSDLLSLAEKKGYDHRLLNELIKGVALRDLKPVYSQY
jgi:hypothetical protein